MAFITFYIELQLLRAMPHLLRLDCELLEKRVHV